MMPCFFIYLLIIASTVLTIVGPVTASTGDATVGKTTYDRLCISCHGPIGQGGPMAGMLSVPPRNLTDNAYMSTRSDQHLFEVIKRGGAAMGLSPDMRAFGGQLTDQEIWNAVAYVRTLASPTTTASDKPLAPISADTQAAPGDLSLTHLRLSIWPEYDDPRVLIILRGELTPGSTFPTLITLPVPKDAELIGAGMISEQNELLLNPHRLLAGETEDRLEIDLQASRFFVEFYYDPFNKETDKRFTYSMRAPYTIERMEVDVQQPLQATNFMVVPPPQHRQQDESGFIYHWWSDRDIEPGETLTFTVSYVKTVATPSVSKPQVEPTATDQPRTATDMTLLAFGLLLGATILFGGGIWLWKGFLRRPDPTSSGQSPSPTAAMAPSSSAVDTDSVLRAKPANFCSACGCKLQPPYRFCPDCGTPLHLQNIE